MDLIPLWPESSKQNERSHLHPSTIFSLECSEQYLRSSIDIKTVQSGEDLKTDILFEVRVVHIYVCPCVNKEI